MPTSREHDRTAADKLASSRVAIQLVIMVNRGMRTRVVAVVTLTVAASAHVLAAQDSLEVVFLDVGQGDAVRRAMSLRAMCTDQWP
jgi:beta-lactamase superfamily II metal-dependent hydrolase